LGPATRPCGGFATSSPIPIQAPIILGAIAGCNKKEQTPAASTPTTPGAPPTFGTAPETGPEVNAGTFAEAEKLMQVTMTPKQRNMAVKSWRRSMAAQLERRTGPRKLALEPTLSPATRWNPALPGIAVGPKKDWFLRSGADQGPLPSDDADIAFSPVTALSRWIQSKKLTSERLTGIYLARIEKFDPKLRAIITLNKEGALAAARQADKEIAAGKYRGPLHGIPYGVKDLLDTAGIATTWGAEPFRNRVPTADSAVVARLNAAGGVLIAKLSLGALALNDIWFGDRR
jgi:hypothetical protein